MDLDDEELEATRKMFEGQFKKYTYKDDFRQVESKKGDVWLTPAEGKIFRLFVDKKKLTYEQLYAEIYGIEVKKTTEKQRRSIRLHICRLNKKIKNLARIKSVCKIGYYLDEK